MLENIKLILDINDDSKDALILLYINKVTQQILNYCGIDILPTNLNDFVEDKVISILKSAINPASTGEVKAVTRGDTRIEYTTTTSESSGGSSFSPQDKSILNRYRKVVLA